MCNKELSTSTGVLDPSPLDAAQRYGKIMLASGYFQGSKDIAQAAVKILIGSELGIPPGASMSGINIIQGKPEVSPALLAASVRKSGIGRIDVVESNDNHCILQAYRNESGTWCKMEPVSFTMGDAEKAKLAGKENWKKHPSDMLYARALSRVCRRYFQDVFIGAGGSVYTPGEISQAVDVTPAPEMAKAEDINQKLKAKRAAAAEPTPEAVDAVFEQMKKEEAA